MNLIYLHGPPASGKLTISNAILEIVPGKLFDNYAAIDLARTIFDFGTPGFWSLVGSVRSDVIAKASEYGVSLLVMTSCYSHPHDYDAFSAIESSVQRHGGQVLPVYLECSRENLNTRVGNQDRVDRKKIRTHTGLNEFLNQWSIGPVPRDNCSRVRSDEEAPSKTADAIIRHFQLRA